MTIDFSRSVVASSPLEAIDLVLEQLEHGPYRSSMLTPSEAMSHLGTLCEGYRCKMSELPGGLGMMAEVLQRRGASFGIETAKFIDLLQSHGIALLERELAES